jgi:hypothetical protein
MRTLLIGESMSPDLSIYHFGRGDAKRTDLDTEVTFNLSGLNAWDNHSSLQIVSPNVGMTLASFEGELPSSPTTGATAILGQTVDWKNQFAPLIDATKGDTTLVTQLVGIPSDAPRYTTIARGGIARGFSMTDGQPATLAATLEPIVRDRSLTLRWRGSQFAALVSEVGRGARPAPTATLAINTLPEPIASGNNFFSSYYAGLPTLVAFPPFPGADDFDQTVAYGNPFGSMGARWSELVTVVYACTVPIPTNRGVGSLPARLVAAMPVAALSEAGVIAPVISPVRAVSIEGITLDRPRTRVGASPTITWDAPSTGIATDFVVAIQAVDASSEGVSVKTIATLHTKATSLRLPPGVIASGNTYVLTITAVSAPGADLTAQPFIGSLPFASADYVTAWFTP